MKRALAAVVLAVCACGSEEGGTTPGPTSGTEGPKTGPVGDPTPIGGWRERILGPDGAIDWAAWDYVAAHYHEDEIVEWRLGPKRSDYASEAGRARGRVDQPDPEGLWRAGLDPALARAFCQTPDKLPRNEAEERALYDEGGGWIESGQLLFTPDAKAPGYGPEFALGVANIRAFDGAMARKREGGQVVTRALCMRMRAEWQADWWNRNAISTPESPGVKQLRAADPDLPLPAVATARGGAQASVTGFLAFQNGIVMAAGTGNDPYTGFGTPVPYPTARLAAGKVPTALAVTPGNEFVFVTVWDRNTKTSELAVVAVGAGTFPATVPEGWGVQSWPAIGGLKVLGYVPLPMFAPTAVAVGSSKLARNLRGTSVVEDGERLSSPAARDAYRAIPWNTPRTDEDAHKIIAEAGYVMVASRAENKVAFLDLRPLFRFTRDQYLTTQARYDATRRDAQGPADGQWPYTFAFEGASRPTLLGIVDVPRPTAVMSRLLLPGTNARASVVENDWSYAHRTALIASIDGTVGLYDVASLVDPSKTPAVPALVKKVTVGPNPVQLAQPIAGDGIRDDVFVVSRGRGSIHVLDAKLGDVGVLDDDRLVDPVFLSIGGNGAGYGGAGKDYAVWARVLTVLDRDGRQVVDYGMYVDGGTREEQWPFPSAGGKRTLFLHGFSNPLPGKPFMFTIDEVI